MKLFELFEATASVKKARKEARLAAQREKTRLEKEQAERAAKNRAQAGNAPSPRQLAIQRMMTPVQSNTVDDRRAAHQAEIEKISPELRQYYDPGNEDVQGVYLRFETQPGGKTMDAYWTTKLGTKYNAAKTLGATETLSTDDSSYAKLFNWLLKTNEYVHVIVDKKNMRDNPDRFRVIMNYLNQFSDDYLTGEFDNEEPVSAPVAAPAKKTAAPKPAAPKMPAAKIESVFVSLFKNHPDLSAQLARVPKQMQQEVRADINAAIEEYSGDMESILPEVKEILHYALAS